jgi:hypothetical protein
MLADSEFLNAVGNLAIFALVLDFRTEICVLQGDAVLIAARRIDNLSSGSRAVRLHPIAATTTKSGGYVLDFFALTASSSWGKLSHRTSLPLLR